MSELLPNNIDTKQETRKDPLNNIDLNKLNNIKYIIDNSKIDNIDNITGIDEIQSLQLLLKELGYYNKRIDGKKGKGTNQAILDFKKDFGDISHFKTILDAKIRVQEKEKVVITDAKKEISQLKTDIPMPSSKDWGGHVGDYIRETKTTPEHSEYTKIREKAKENIQEVKIIISNGNIDSLNNEEHGLAIRGLLKEGLQISATNGYEKLVKLAKIIGINIPENKPKITETNGLSPFVDSEIKGDFKIRFNGNEFGIYKIPIEGTVDSIKYIGKLGSDGYKARTLDEIRENIMIPGFPKTSNFTL